MMSYVPTPLDHDLALRLCETATLSDAERVTCTLIALAALVGEAVQADTHAAFRTILRATAAS